MSQYPEELQKHAEWAEDILARHPELNGDTVHLILQDEVGHVFAQVLADAGVYKMDEAGRAGCAVPCKRAISIKNALPLSPPVCLADGGFLLFSGGPKTSVP